MWCNSAGSGFCSSLRFRMVQAAVGVRPAARSSNASTRDARARLTRLTEPGCCTQPWWSADGRRVLFIDRPAPDAPTGIYAASRRGKLGDMGVMGATQLGVAVPNFWFAMILVLIFAVNLGWLPSGGSDSWVHGILPVITLGTAGAAVLARFTRSAMLEVLGQPYVRTASAKGLAWRRVVVDHALPNAAIPTVTIVGFMVGSLVAGAVVVESVFSWPGVGRLLVVAVANRDLAVVQTILLFVALTMVCANLTVDMLYGWIDPRLRTRRVAGAG